MTGFPAVHHVVLTVTNLEASREWYRRLLAPSRFSTRTCRRCPDTTKGFHHTVFSVPGGPLLALHAARRHRP